MGNKKGLNTRVITTYHPDTDEEFELFVTYEYINKDDSDEEEGLFVDDEIDIKSYEPNNEVDELPSWLTEDIVYESLYSELELDELEEDEFTEEEEESGYYEDLTEESEEEEY